ncbi:MAG: hypothetical protein J1F61_00625 [Clostridiales bacterium]|nr:hypothetical protein [Clostridiales bacterium]
MKNKKRLFLTLAVSAVMAFGAVGFSACGNNSDGEKTHEHTYATSWSGDDENHWHAATCEHTDIVKDKAAHIDEDNDEKCDVCDRTLPHHHKYSDQWSSDENYHWYASTCGHTSEVKDRAEHIDEDENKKCDICGYEFHEHQYAEEWTRTLNEHWHAPTCGDTTELKDKGIHADENNDEKCDVCEYPMPHKHKYSQEWSSDENNHWHAPTCGDTTELKDKGIHVDENNDEKCDVCGHDMPSGTPISISANSTQDIAIDLEVGIYELSFELNKSVTAVKGGLTAHVNGTTADSVYDMYEGLNETYYAVLFVREDSTAITLTNTTGSDISASYFIKEYKAPTLTADGTEYVVPYIYLPASNSAEYPALTEYRRAIIPIAPSITGNYNITINYSTDVAVFVYSSLNETKVFKTIMKSTGYSDTVDLTGVESLHFRKTSKSDCNITVKIEPVTE